MSYKLFTLGVLRRELALRQASRLAMRLFLPGFCVSSAKALALEQERHEKELRAARMLANRRARGTTGKGKGRGASKGKGKGVESKQAPTVRAIRWETMGRQDVKGTIFDRRRGSIMPGLFGATVAAMQAKRSDEVLSAAPRSPGSPDGTLQNMSAVYSSMLDVFSNEKSSKGKSGKGGGSSSGGGGGGSGGGSGGGKKKEKGGKTLQLDQGAAKNIEIAIAGTLGKMSLEAAADAIRSLDFEAMPSSTAETLLNAKQAFEIGAVAPVKRHIDDGKEPIDESYSLTDRFIAKVVVGVPACVLRLRCMAFMGTMRELEEEVVDRSELLLAVCEEVKASRKFKLLLRDVILPLGNHLNETAGNKAAGAAGIRMSSLNQTVMLRSRSGASFLEFIVETLWRHSRRLLAVVDEFPSLM